MNSGQIEAIIKRITGRDENLFRADLEDHRQTVSDRIRNKSVLVIGGAGSIGSRFIKELIRFEPARVLVVDTNENELAELVRDIRSGAVNAGVSLTTYPISFNNPIFERIFAEQGPFDIVANFAALKHVRSEKDPYAIQAMFENNFLHANKLLSVIVDNPPSHFFCVSTDKATNPVSIMGATKKLMEDVIFSYRDRIRITTARFANVAFSNGSLSDSFIRRYEKNQPIVCPSDISRYFVSPEEAGTLCLLACILGDSGQIFIPRLSPEKDLIPFKNTVVAFFNELGIGIDPCRSEEEAREKIKQAERSGPDPYPVYFFNTDTSGEKPFEEFFTERDTVDWHSFRNIGIIKQRWEGGHDVDGMLKDAGELFGKEITRELILGFLTKYIPGFTYAEKGKVLDQKM